MKKLLPARVSKTLLLSVILASSAYASPINLFHRAIAKNSRSHTVASRDDSYTLSEVLSITSYQDNPNSHTTMATQSVVSYTADQQRIANSATQISSTVVDNFTGKPLEQIDSHNNKASTQFDALGRGVESDYYSADNNDTYWVKKQYIFDQPSQCVSPRAISCVKTISETEDKHAGYITEQDMDSLGRKVANYDNGGNDANQLRLVGQKYYNDLNNLSRQIDAVNVATTYQYDAQSRKLLSTVGGEISIHSQYDDVLNTTTKWSSSVATKKQTSHIEKDNDDSGDVISQAIIRNTTNLLGASKTVRDHETFDNFGQMRTQDTPRESDDGEHTRLRQKIEKSYGALGQVQTLTTDGAPSTANLTPDMPLEKDFDYDITGKQTSVLLMPTEQPSMAVRNYRLLNDGNGNKIHDHLLDKKGNTLYSKDFSYDSNNNVDQVVDWHADKSGNSYVKYQYKNFMGKDRATQQTLIFSDKTVHEIDNGYYHSNGRLKQQVDKTTGEKRNYNYYLDGKLKTKTYTDSAGNQKSLTYGYDNIGELTSMDYSEVPTTGSKVNYKVVYTYDGGGATGKRRHLVNATIFSAQDKPVAGTNYHYSSDNGSDQLQSRSHYLISVDTSTGKEQDTPIDKTNVTTQVVKLANYPDRHSGITNSCATA